MNIESNITFKETPILIRKSDANKKEYYINTSTGKLSYNIKELVEENEEYCLVHERKNSKIGIVDIGYDETLNMLVVMLLEFNSYKPKEGEIRQPSEVNRIYITPEKELIFKESHWKYSLELRRIAYVRDKEYTKHPGHSVGSLMPFNMDKYYFLNKNSFQNIFKLFPKFVTLSGNKLIELNNLTNFVQFLKYKEPLAKDGPKQKEVDELIEIKLPEVENIPSAKKFAIISRVPGKELCVLRTFLNSVENGLYEGGRIYIGKKKVIPCKLSNTGKYIKSTLLDKPEHWNFLVADFNPENTKGTKLEYFGEILNEINVDNRGLAIWSFVKWDITEKLFKSELKDFMKHILKQSIDENPIRLLENYVGKISTNEKNIYKILGLNKYQVDKLITDIKLNTRNGWDKFTPILATKIMLTGTSFSYPYYFLRYYKNPISISDFDNESFDRVYEMAKKLNTISYQYSSFITCYANFTRLYGVKNMINYMENVYSLKNYFNTSSGYYKYYIYLEFYKDYLSIVEQIGDTVNFKYHFKTEEDVQRMHDAAITVYNLQKDHFSTLKFNKQIEKWKKWEYSNEEYSIVAPTKPNDLAFEGIELHHCVKSYIEKVANGYTNVLFLRKNNNIDKPFFTIEISNEGIIEQIHGFSNCNMSEHPEIIPFVKEWIKEKKLKKSNIDKVR